MAMQQLTSKAVHLWDSSNSAPNATCDLSPFMWSTAQCCHHTQNFWNDLHTELCC